MVLFSCCQATRISKLWFLYLCFSCHFFGYTPFGAVSKYSINTNETCIYKQFFNKHRCIQHFSSMQSSVYANSWLRCCTRENSVKCFARVADAPRHNQPRAHTDLESARAPSQHRRSRQHRLSRQYRPPGQHASIPCTPRPPCCCTRFELCVPPSNSARAPGTVPNPLCRGPAPPSAHSHAALTPLAVTRQ
jgi:hypothetical protein